MGRAIALAAAAWAVAALVFVGMTGGVSAHDHSKPELDEWFKSLTSKKGPCCDGSDYQRVEDPDWEMKDGKYRVRLKGKWHDVPDDAVLTEPNKKGFPMVWPIEYGDQIFIRCFMPGAMI